MNRTIFITGSSTGIGRAALLLFSSKGWNVVATMRKPEKEAELSKLDVLDIESIQKAVHDGIQKFGTIDVLLNNAGYGIYGSLETFSKEKIQRQVQHQCNWSFRCNKSHSPSFPEMSKSALYADAVAEVISKASTDGKNQLRYVVGQDTEMLLFQKQQSDDEIFMNGIKSQFGI